MIKKVKCDKCNGTGEMEVEFCDKCGRQERLGDYDGKKICHQCWASGLTEEDIRNL